MLATGSIFCNARYCRNKHGCIVSAEQRRRSYKTYIFKKSRTICGDETCLTIDQTPVKIKRQIPAVFGVDVPDKEEEYRSGWCYLCGMTRNWKTISQYVCCECYTCQSYHTVTYCVRCVPHCRSSSVAALELSYSNDKWTDNDKWTE